MRQDKRLAVGRLGALVEQIEVLISSDVQVILVRFFDIWFGGRACSSIIL